MDWRLDPKAFLRSLFESALEVADPASQVARHLTEKPIGRLIVIGAGKASAKMAKAVEAHWPDVAMTGLVVTRYGHAVACEKIEIVEAAHPVPDSAGEEAAKRILQMVTGLDADDLVLVLISGGGSSLLSLPAPGLSLADKKSINAALLKSGATISEINCVRKHLSAIKGGRLGIRIAPARSITLLISDVPGDDPKVIASGPTFGEEMSAADALGILNKYGISLSTEVERHLQSPSAECPGPNDARLARATWRMIATPKMALEAAAQRAQANGVRPIILGDDLEGDARELGKAHAELALQYLGQGPKVLLSGGETSVKVVGNGRGGRNVEYLLSLCAHLGANAQIFGLAADTDGIDGIEEVAGAVIGPDTTGRAQTKGMDLNDFLDRNDAHTFFEALGDQIITGPTLTNVNDFRAILIS
ncbi:glycerate kinase [Rhizobium calliandrae]|uniref:Glycerate kinase n=1 Tax=Rhizobium calliandrae TaxID=1312182 RepID=A0ABT7KMQ1_9HYPH|nr:glycerate kinase [Rhizobium calliandrae]MDL2409919.1 glycerate kinase [Rhizobium calliandrae]